MEFLESEVANITVLDIKKLMIRRRHEADTLSLTPYQSEIVQNSITLKNEYFMREFRLPYTPEEFTLLERDSGTENLYYKGDLLYELQERDDDYEKYQLEYLREKIRGTALKTCNNVFEWPDFTFYGLEKSYYLQCNENNLFNVIRYITELSDSYRSYKYPINHVMCTLYQIMNVLQNIHQAGITLSGDFSSLVFHKQVVKISALAFNVGAPENFASGVVKDLIQFKNITEKCIPIFIKARNRIFSDDVNQLFEFTNEAIQLLEGKESDESELIGVKPGELSSIIANLPFFSSPLYLHFLSRDLTHYQLIKPLIVPEVSPQILEIDYEIKLPKTEAQNFEENALNQTPSVRTSHSKNAMRYYGHVCKPVDITTSSDLAASELLQLTMEAERAKSRGFFASTSRMQRNSASKRSKSMGFFKSETFEELGAGITARPRRFLVPSITMPRAEVIVGIRPACGIREVAEPYPELSAYAEQPATEPNCTSNQPNSHYLWEPKRGSSRVELRDLMRALME